MRLRADGALDRSFGSAGIASTTFPGTMFEAWNAVTIQPNGRILAGGSTTARVGEGTVAQFALARDLGS